MAVSLDSVLPQSTVGFVPIPADNWLRCYSLRLNPGKISSTVQETMKTLRCPNKDCRLLGKIAPETIIRFGFYRRAVGSVADIDAKLRSGRQFFRAGFADKTSIGFPLKRRYLDC